MPSGLSSPRNRASALADMGERSAFVAGQRVGRPRRARPRRRARLRRLLGSVLATMAITAAGGAGLHWMLTTQHFAVTSVEVRGVSRVAPDQILAVAAIQQGTNIFRLDRIDVIGRVEVRPGTEDWDERLARLEGLLAQIATQDVRTVDLRFRDQVVFQRSSIR